MRIVTSLSESQTVHHAPYQLLDISYGTLPSDRFLSAFRLLLNPMLEFRIPHLS